MAQEIFSKNIKYLRTKTNMTQQELANKLFVTGQAVSKWEQDKSMPDTTMLKPISELFNCSIDDLLTVDIEAKDLESKKEINSEVETKQENKAEEIVESKHLRNVYVYSKTSKEYKSFFIIMLCYFLAFIIFFS